jgi:Ca-activated chloride channel family protein
VSLVAYSDEVQVLIRCGPADAPARRVAEQRLQQLQAGGNTDLCAGWLRGCEQVGFGLDGGRLGRCLLLTDGLANLGITDRKAIVGHATELRSRGVTTSTLGVGRDFDEVLLREMAEAGGGNFYFAEGASTLSDFIAGETGEALKVVARDAALVLDLPEGAAVTSPNPFRIRTEQTRTVIELGDLVEDQVLSLVVTVEIPGGPDGRSVPVQCWLWDPNGVLEGSADLAFRYAGQREYRAETRDRAVDREVIEAYAAAARRRAAEHARAGEAAKGREILRHMAAEVRRVRGNDAQLTALAHEIEQEAARLGQMDNLDFKRLEFATFGALRSKDEDGLTLGTMSFTSRTLNLMMQAQHGASNGTWLRVTAVTSDAEGTHLVETAGRALAAADARAFAWSVVDGGARILDPGAGVAMSRDDEISLAYALASTGDAVKVAFVRGLLEDGAASHWHPKERAAIVSLSAWDEAPAAPAAALVACEILLQALRQRCPAWNPEVPVHPPNAQSCWGDSADGAADIERKILAGDICPTCREMFKAAGIDVDGLLSLLCAVRALAERPSAAPS